MEEDMGFVKTRAELDRYYGLGVREFIDAKMLGVMFETRMEIVERLLPPPLDPPDAAGGLIFIAEYPETNLGPGYREAALFIRCKYQGEAGSYCLSMPIDSHESRIYNGRDIFGFPKKKAGIHVEKSPNFLFKGSPRIDLQPGFDGPVMLCRHQTTVEMKSVEIGAAEVVLRESEDDPWAEIEITNVNIGFYLVSDNTMQPGRVLGEVDGDAYLPYYFKMTDFFSG
jgi:acetoacetate decarboxylase